MQNDIFDVFRDVMVILFLFLLQLLQQAASSSNLGSFSGVQQLGGELLRLCKADSLTSEFQHAYLKKDPR